MIQKWIYNYFERNPKLRVLFLFDKMGGIEADLSERIWPEDYVCICLRDGARDRDWQPTA